VQFVSGRALRARRVEDSHGDADGVLAGVSMHHSLIAGLGA